MLGSPGTTLAHILDDLEALIPADPGIEIVTMCNRFLPGDYSVDWAIDDWARDRGNAAVQSFADVADAVSYVKGHRLIAFIGDGDTGRVADATARARRMRRWYQKPYKHFRPVGRYVDDRIRVNVYTTGA